MPQESTIHPHVPSERAEHFNADDSGSTETEYLALLTALVRVHKPSELLETGAWNGAGTMALASALRMNGFGRLTSVEQDQHAAARVRDRLGMALYSPNLVEIVCANSLDYLAKTYLKFDFAFLDSHLPTRADELNLLLDRKLLRPGALVAIHDTSRVREMPAGRRDPDGEEFWRKMDASVFTVFEVIEFPLSRGMLLIRIP